MTVNKLLVYANEITTAEIIGMHISFNYTTSINYTIK